MTNIATSWADGPLLAFDLETTGTDTAQDRIVTATVISILPGDPPDVRTWLADPGVEIPAAAAEVHGISTEHAREHGRDGSAVVADVAAALQQLWTPGTPLCAFNASFDLSLLDAELRRHHDRSLVVSGPVVDPRCIDKQLDRYRRGKRTLGALCEHYRVRLDAAHDSAADALAAARLAWRLAKDNPDDIGTRDPADLHDLQITWYRDQQHDFADYLAKRAAAAQDPTEAEELTLRSEAVRGEAENWPLTPVG